MNFIDTYMRKGLYPAKSFPFRIGQESSGTVVRLPEDSSLVQDEQFKKRGIQVGAKVIAVSATLLSLQYQIPLKRMHMLILI